VLELAHYPEQHPELGRMLSTHRGRPRAGGAVLWVAPLLVIGGIVTAIEVLIDLVKGAAFASVSDLLPGIAAIAVGVALLAYALFVWRQSLGIYEHGFVLHRLTGTRVVRWADIRSATPTSRNDSSGRTFEIDVELRSGSGFTLTDALGGIEPQAELFRRRGGLG